MSKQGERSAPADDWWSRLYDESSPDIGGGAPAADDTLDDRFASATDAVSVPEQPRASPQDPAFQGARQAGEGRRHDGDAPAREDRPLQDVPGAGSPAGGPRDFRDDGLPGGPLQDVPDDLRAGDEWDGEYEDKHEDNEAGAQHEDEAGEPRRPGRAPEPGSRDPRASGGAGAAREGSWQPGQPDARGTEGAPGTQESHRRPPAWWEHAPQAPWEPPAYTPSYARPLPTPPGVPPGTPDLPEAVGGPGGDAAPEAPSASGEEVPPRSGGPAAAPVGEHPGTAYVSRPEDLGPQDIVPPLPRRPSPSVSSAPPSAGHGGAPASAEPWDAPTDPRTNAALPPERPRPPAAPARAAAGPPPRPWMPPAPATPAPAPAEVASGGTEAPTPPVDAPGAPAPVEAEALPVRPQTPAPAETAPVRPQEPAQVEGPARPRVGFVGFRPPTYDSEPTTLPQASSGELHRVVPDTVLDGARYGTYTLRAASVRGDSARYRGEPRRDALLTARFGAGADALLFVALATGARAAEGAHRAAADACEWIGEAVCRSHARLADDIKDARAEALKSGLHRLTDRTYGKLRARAAELGLDTGEYATSLRCLLLSADPRVRLRVFFGVGTGGLFRLRDHEWEDLEPGLPVSADGPGEPEDGVGPLGLPPETSEGDRLTIDFGIPQVRPPLVQPPVPPPDQPFRFHASTARAGDTLLLCGDGFAEPLRGEPGLAGALSARWSALEAPSLVEYLADVQVRAKGYADDRTAVGVWEA